MPGQGRAASPSARAHRALELFRLSHPRLLRQHDPSSETEVQPARKPPPVAAKPHRGSRGSSPRTDTADHGEGGRRSPSRVNPSRHLRRRAARGPCGGGRQGRRGRHGYASARGNRAPSPAGGCSAGTCACSLGLQVFGETVLNHGQTCRALCVQDVGAPDMAQPVNGTGDPRPGQTKPLPGVKHRDFHNVSTAGDLGCGKSTSVGRTGGWP
jgi:hypothetical protein